MVKGPKIPGNVIDILKKPKTLLLLNSADFDYTPYTYLSEGSEADVGEPLSVSFSAGAAVKFTTSFPEMQSFFNQHPEIPKNSVKVARWTVTIRCVTNPANARIGVIDNTDGAWINIPARKSIGRFGVNPARPSNGEFLLGHQYTQPIPFPASWLGMNFTFVNAAPGDELSWDQTGFGNCTLSIINGKVSLCW